jgi:hypothetical protein
MGADDRGFLFIMSDKGCPAQKHGSALGHERICKRFCIGAAAIHFAPSKPEATRPVPVPAQAPHCLGP